MNVAEPDEKGYDDALYTVRLLSPDGHYPKQSFCDGVDAVLGVDEDLVWSAVHQFQQIDLYPEGATSRLTPGEVMFYSALSLAEAHPLQHGRLGIFVAGEAVDVRFDGLNGSESALLERSRAIAKRLASAPATRWSVIPSVEQKPSFSERCYEDETRRLLEAMTTDRLLLRGLYKFLMAAELRRFPHFLEESALSAFISREAALELLRRKLSEASGGRLNKDDVFEHIRQVFPTGEPFVGVLQTDWEARVLMVHPVSKFGEYWSPPVTTEECFDALYSVIHLFRYLLIDEVWRPVGVD